MEALLLAMFLFGLASGLHCVGMCGGVVAAFSSRRLIAIVDASRPAPEWRRQLAFNAGRVATYALAGAAAGALGGAAQLMQDVLPAQTALFVLAQGALILVGLHLAGAGRVLARLEDLGAPLWRRVQPAVARLCAARGPLAALAAGALWGVLPCAMVYGALATATLAGGAVLGALAMLAFGAGTLPWLLAAGASLSRLRGWAGLARLRVAAGALLLGMGVFGLARASELGAALRAGFLCLT
ncbi:MAG: sulfite exporter TauE/SafE family protein [Betaproteobacteria bacterium]|nr:sulfite exporter TauE/SafE family protein [Betaproteobacteria bacterium]